jgi:Predicted membrane protein (DUF2254)
VIRSRDVSAVRRLWLWPIAILIGVSLALFAGFYLVDGGGGSLDRYLRFEPSMIVDALPGLAGMTAAVLGIVITVVSIIVQLSAERYTGVARLFLRDRLNVAVMAYFIVACVCGVWLSLAVHHDFVPRAAVLAMLAFTTAGLVVMLPYFAYVFRFLEPQSIIGRIRAAAVTTVTEAVTAPPAVAVAAQADVLTALAELTDITSNSISGKDKIIASRAVDAIKDFVVGYLAIKGRAPAAWFAIGDDIREDPDFVAMDPESLRDLEGHQTWVEWKALRQYLGIYNEALTAMPDIDYLIAIDTRYVGEAAAARGDQALVGLVFKFMNSYLRATINAKAVRTAYNVLNQYRLLVEAMIKRDQREVANDAVGHMIYYGRTSYDLQLGFVTETVAYDVGALCELAHAHGGRDEAMLTAFLDLDQPLRAKRQESALLGIRKAQVKLACYYLEAGAEDRARRIAADLRAEPAERLATIHDQLERVDTKEFWEIIDRGRNFEFMPAAQRRHMGRFFASLVADASAT